MSVTRNSKVVETFIYFTKNISNVFDWVYNDNIDKIIALTGATVPNGRTMHSQEYIYINKII